MEVLLDYLADAEQWLQLRRQKLELIELSSSSIACKKISKV
jgi:hypothetical protein